MKKLIYSENETLCIVTKQKGQCKVEMYARDDVVDAYAKTHSKLKNGEVANLYALLSKKKATVEFIPQNDPVLIQRIKNKDYIKESGDTIESARRIMAITAATDCAQCINCDSCVLKCPPCKAALLCPMFNDKKAIYDESIKIVVQNAIKLYGSCFYTKDDVVNLLKSAGVDFDILSEVGYYYFALFEDPRPMRSYIEFCETKDEAKEKFEHMKRKIENEYEYTDSSITTSNEDFIERTGMNRSKAFSIKASYGFALDLIG